MKQEELLNHLINAGGNISQELEDIAGELIQAMQKEAHHKLTLQDLHHSQEVLEADILLAEESKEGRINGSNQSKRDKQALLLLQELASNDGPYAKVRRETRKHSQQYEWAKLEVEQLRQRFSASRHQARLIAAALNALAE